MIISLGTGRDKAGFNRISVLSRPFDPVKSLDFFGEYWFGFFHKFPSEKCVIFQHTRVQKSGKIKVFLSRCPLCNQFCERPFEVRLGTQGT